MAIERLDSAFADAQVAGENLTGKEMYLAHRNGDKELVICGSTEVVAGVIQKGTVAGKSTTISRGPICKVVGGAAIAAGAILVSDSTGRAVTGTTGRFGIARNAISAANEIVEVAMD